MALLVFKVGGIVAPYLPVPACHLPLVEGGIHTPDINKMLGKGLVFFVSGGPPKPHQSQFDLRMAGIALSPILHKMLIQQVGGWKTMICSSSSGERGL